MLRQALCLLAATVTLTTTTGYTAAAAPPTGPWTGGWSTSPQREAGPVFTDQTLRMFVHPTLGGSPIRVRLANTFGTKDVTFKAINVARAVTASSADLVAGTARRVTFGGRTSVTVPVGTSRLSDPVNLSVGVGQDLAVDLYVTAGGDATAITGHDAAQGTQFVAAQQPGWRRGRRVHRHRELHVLAG
nr:hypothetical protein GCM10020092_077100 [Actinoplanes digitatis]